MEAKVPTAATAAAPADSEAAGRGRAARFSGRSCGVVRRSDWRLLVTERSDARLAKGALPS
jgi:hypothetical protein